MASVPFVLGHGCAYACVHDTVDARVRYRHRGDVVDDGAWWCDVNNDACDDADDGDGTCTRNGDAGDGGDGDTMTTWVMLVI